MDVLVIAYINKNFGDDLFVDMLCRRYPEHTFHLIAAPEMTTYLSHIPNLKIHSYNRIIRSINGRLLNLIGRNLLVEKLVNQYKYCVCIGGSIFMQAPNWRKVIEERENIQKKASKYYIISANFGPFQNQKYVQHYNIWFSGLTDVCFRDKYSFGLFSNLPKIRYAPDAIFGYSDIKREHILNARKLLVISVIDYSWRNSTSFAMYEKEIAQITSRYLNCGWKVVLLALCVREGDGCAIERISGMLKDKNVNNLEKYTYDGNYEKVYNLLINADFVIASRFHATVVPLSAGIPVLPIPYSNKTRNMLKDVGYGGPIWELDNGSISVQEIERAQKYHFDAKDLVQQADKQFQGVDRLLK